MHYDLDACDTGFYQLLQARNWNLGHHVVEPQPCFCLDQHCVVRPGFIMKIERLHHGMPQAWQKGIPRLPLS